MQKHFKTLILTHIDTDVFIHALGILRFQITYFYHQRLLVLPNHGIVVKKLFWLYAWGHFVTAFIFKCANNPYGKIGLGVVWRGVVFIQSQLVTSPIASYQIERSKTENGVLGKLL